MIASAMVIVRDLSPSFILVRFVTMRLNTERRFSSPLCLPFGLPLRPFRKRVAFGGLPYPTSGAAASDGFVFFVIVQYSRFYFLGSPLDRPKLRLNSSYSSGGIGLDS